MAENITVEIDDGGAVQVKVEGCPGPSCKALTRDLEKDLGKVTADRATAEMSQQAKRVQKQ